MVHSQGFIAYDSNNSLNESPFVVRSTDVLELDDAEGRSVESRGGLTKMDTWRGGRRSIDRSIDRSERAFTRLHRSHRLSQTTSDERRVTRDESPVTDVRAAVVGRSCA